MEYRRARIEGGTYFFTVVTDKRRKFLCVPENILLLREAFREVMEEYPFNIDACVVLPNHIHCVWTLPKGDGDFSNRWRLIKNYFTRRCDGKYRGPVSPWKKKKNEQGIWQSRFWEHCISDETDFINHVEYVHYNPVKHGLVKAPKDWQYSSFHKYVRDGIYDVNWGAETEIVFDENVGKE
jgi:putative transposase